MLPFCLNPLGDITESRIKDNPLVSPKTFFSKTYVCKNYILLRIFYYIELSFYLELSFNLHGRLVSSLQFCPIRVCFLLFYFILLFLVPAMKLNPFW